MPPAPKPGAAANTASFLANPLVAYGIGGLLLLLAVWAIIKALPSLFGGLEKGGKAGFDMVDRAFSGYVDRMTTAYADIVKRPESQVSDQRTRTDQVKGVLVQGDRALSDAVDSPYEYFRGLIMGPRVN